MRFRKISVVFGLSLLLCLMIVVHPAQPAWAEADETRFIILHTNDEHSALIPHSSAADYDPDGPDPTVGGFARLATAIEEVRADAGDVPVLLFSAGDFIGGTPFSWLTLDGQATELGLMRLMGYDAVTLGNHEFDYGPGRLAAYLATAGYPDAAQETVMLSANALIPSGHPLIDAGLSPTHVFTLPDSGLRIGVFGLLGDHALSVAAEVDPLQFVPPVEFAGAVVRRLQDEGVDLIVVLSHAGVEEDRELAREVAGIDVIVGGHCHTALHQPVVEAETIIVQAGSSGRYLGCLELSYDPASGSLRIENGESGRQHLVPIDDSLPPDPAVQSRVEAAVDRLNEFTALCTGGRYDDMKRVIARSGFVVSRDPPLQESAYGNLIADAFRWSVQEATGERVDFAFQANGQIRDSLHPASSGDLCFYDIASTVGLGSGPGDSPGYPLISTYLTGDEVRRVLEIGPLLSAIMGDVFFLQSSGLRLTYDPGRSILLWLPLVDKPVPTYRAVLTAERYVGDDPAMTGDDYVPLDWKDEQLYHVVSDVYIASFIPMVGDMLPRLAVQPRDRSGQPVADPASLIVHREGRPLTAWEAVTDYLAAMPAGPEGHPEIPAQYAQPAGRQRQVDTVPLILWPVLALLLLIAATVWFLLRRRANRGNGSPA